MAMKSYVVACSSDFRDRVLALAERKGVAVSDLVSGLISLLHPHDIERFSDPGDAPSGDRDEVLLQSGPRAGRILKRKPRLQLRLPDGLEDGAIRRVLAMALALDEGRLVLRPTDPNTALVALEEKKALETALTQAHEASEELRALVGILAFETLPDGVASISDARYILGFPPQAPLTRQTLKARFRMLSQIYHPDKPTGHTYRMSQLIEATRFLEQRLAPGAA